MKLIILALLLLIGLSLGIYISILSGYYKGIVYTVLIIGLLAYLVIEDNQK